jgi:hypothetical protein
MPRLSSSKVVSIKNERRCFSCGKIFPKGTKMLSQKYFPEGRREFDFQTPQTIHVDKECLVSPKLIELFEATK